LELRLTPFLLLLRRTLDKLEELDVAEVFAEPVSKIDAPDYHDVIKHPMDFSTIASKIENHLYRFEIVMIIIIFVIPINFYAFAPRLLYIRRLPNV